MIYRDFQGLKLSALGFGAMRLPVLDGDDSRIDEAAALRMVDTAMQSGINYYDTAWGYHGENSETVMGKALARYPRDSFYVATKFPGYDASNWSKVKEIFPRQLEKLGVDYFDFYLFHNVCEMNIDAYLDDEKYGIYSYLMAQKRQGRIRHLGFSCHGELDVLKRFLDAYGKDMEFCQLQLNYLDWTFQHGKEKVELLRQWGIPVWVMEPLRGGKLARLQPEHEAALTALRPDEEIPAWAFRFLQSIPSVPAEHPLCHRDPLRHVQPGAAGEESQDLRGRQTSDRGGNENADGYRRPDALPRYRALHGLPLLRQPLPHESGYSAFAFPVQRARLHRRRLHRPHGAQRTARR